MGEATMGEYQELLAQVRQHNLDIKLIWVTDERIRKWERLQEYVSQHICTITFSKFVLWISEIIYLYIYIEVILEDLYVKSMKYLHYLFCIVIFKTCNILLIAFLNFDKI